jgi:O-antigen biosynthesis protein
VFHRLELDKLEELDINMITNDVCNDIYENSSKTLESLEPEFRQDRVDPFWADFRFRVQNLFAPPQNGQHEDENRTIGFRLRSRSSWDSATALEKTQEGFSVDYISDLQPSVADGYDVILCMESFRHLSDKEAQDAIRPVCAATSRILFSASPPPDEDKVTNRLWVFWLRTFAKDGFAPIASFDASFIRPWAIALERSGDAISDELMVLHGELVAARTRLWRESETLKLALADTRRAFVETAESLATRHVEAPAINAGPGLMQRFSRFQRRLHFVRQSIFFDPDWYRQKYGDVPEDADPAEHYLTTGSQLGRDPGPAFSASGYLAANPDVVETGYDPLVHFERYGKFEGRPAVFPLPGIGPLILKRIVRPDEKKAAASAGAPANEEDYQDWIARFDRLSDQDRKAIRRHIESLPLRPLISVAMPVYETPPALLREAFDSILAQLYPHWELCIADDASPSPHVAEILADYASRDSRFRFIRRETKGGISAAANTALTLAIGELIALMDPEDMLSERALYEVAVEWNRHPDAEIIYSDEDRIDESGRRHNPYFKTDWNPELFLGQNMISHLGVYRRSLIEAVDGFRMGLEGSEDYDLALRASRHTTPERIRHIPVVLYHRRAALETQSNSQTNSQRDADSARRARIDHLRALGENAVVEANPLVPALDRVRRRLPDKPPLVSLIVPTRNRADLLGPCLDGLLNRTDYPNREIIVIDHESDEAETLTLLRDVARDPRVRIMPYRGPFNYSDMNNRAVALARGELVGMLNNDVDVINSDWLDEMAALAMRPENGVVGAKLFYPDGSVQHAGVAIGIGGVASHFHLGASGDDPGYCGRLVLISNVSAVTGACMLLRKAVFEEVGGLNARDLAVAFNDVDFSLKVAAAGYRNVWTPFARLYHHESPSRGRDVEPAKAARFLREVRYMQQRWATTLYEDPFYNVNFSLDNSDFKRGAPRRSKPWLDETQAT